MDAPAGPSDDPPDVEPEARIGSGRTAEIFALDDDRVLKLFARDVAREASGGSDERSAERARREFENTRAAHDAGLPVPAPHGLVTVDGRPGIVLERVDGETLLSEVLARPLRGRRSARRFADLHASVHEASATRLPRVRTRVARDVRAAPGLSPADRERVLARLDALPDGDAVCHGDFHPENVLHRGRGPVVLDWLDAGAGPPAADVARTEVLLAFAPGPDGPFRRTAFATLRRAFLGAYVRRYLAVTDVTREQVEAWRLPVAAARLNEGVPEAARLRSFVLAELEGP